MNDVMQYIPVETIVVKIVQYAVAAIIVFGPMALCVAYLIYRIRKSLEEESKYLPGYIAVLGPILGVLPPLLRGKGYGGEWAWALFVMYEPLLCAASILSTRLCDSKGKVATAFNYVLAVLTGGVSAVFALRSLFP